MTSVTAAPLSEKILRQNVSAILQGWYWGHSAEQTAWYLYYNHFRQTWRTHILGSQLAKRWEMARRAAEAKNEEWAGFVPSISDLEDSRLGVVIKEIEDRRFCAVPYPMEPKDAAIRMYRAATITRDDGTNIHDFSEAVQEHLNRLIKAE